jgi:hypothetical protein
MDPLVAAIQGNKRTCPPPKKKQQQPSKTPPHCPHAPSRLHKVNAPLICSSSKAGHIADDPSAQGKERGAAIQPQLQSTVPDLHGPATMSGQ